MFCVSLRRGRTVFSVDDEQTIRDSGKTQRRASFPLTTRSDLVFVRVSLARDQRFKESFL